MTSIAETDLSHISQRDRPPIFSELRLRNFKSINDAVIPLHPLTVVVGANSSGKSTLLQALLLLAQAARAEVGSGRLPFNGEYVQLGEFQEVQTFGAEPTSGISVGLSAEVSRNRPRLRAPRSLSESQKARLAWSGHFSPPGDPRSGYAQLSAMELSLTELSGTPIMALDIASVDDNSVEQDSATYEDPLAVMRGPLLTVDGRASGYQPIETQAVQKARFWGGVPERLYVETTWLTLCARSWWDLWERSNREQLLQLREDHRRGVGPFANDLSGQKLLASVTLAADLIKSSPITREIAVQRGQDLETPRNTALSLQNFFAENLATHSSTSRTSILVSMTALREKTFVEELGKKLRSEEWIKESSSQEMRGRLGDSIRDASSYVRGYLRTLRYLGPIREAPRAIYDPSPSRTDIGVRGEYAAAVLHARAREIVPCPLLGGGIQRMTLSAALNYWLTEFGIATKAEAKDLGRLGMSLTVTPSVGQRSIDLTSVGVGVSQVLPVILLCLLSRSTSLVLLEQPELHLHPAMQLKLADFLLACSSSGQQIIVETHSEHLVNRLRRRVADDQTQTLSRSIGLLFAEQKDGVSQYRATMISRHGGLSQGWPEGFLDVGANEATEFLAEALRRRRESTGDTQTGAAP